METVVADIVANTQTSSPVFALLPPLTVNITTGVGDALLVFFSASGDASTFSRVFFRLRVNAVVVKGATFTVTDDTLGQSTSIVAKITGLLPGVQTVDVEWASEVGTASISPATLLNQQHGTLLVERVAS